MTSDGLILNTEPGQPFIHGTREMDAPVALVWRALTEPDLVARWLGPSRYTIEDVVVDARDGGLWAFTHRADDGSAYGFRGVHHSVEKERSVTRTFEFLGMPGHVSLERLDLEDLGERTGLRFHTTFQSVADRDGMVASGMEKGASESYERLDALLAELKRG